MKRLLLAAAALLICAGATQAADPATTAYKPPLNVFGRPDLEGNWSNATITPTNRQARLGGRAIYTPEEVKELEGAQQAATDKGNAPTADNTKPLTDGVISARGGIGIEGNYNRGWFDPGSLIMRVRGEPRTSILTTPDGQPPARKPNPGAPGRGPGGPGAGRGAFDNPETRGLGERCIISFGRNGGPPMLANGFYNNNYQIVQGRDEIAIMVEMVHDVRHVRMTSRTHLVADLRPWFGDSVGWWEGDTLVVETTNIPQAQAYMGSWRNLKVTERFRRVAKDRLYYGFTVDDPDSWDKPWGGEYEFADLHGQVLEYACHEGNYALEGILAGARAEEAEKAGKSAAAGGPGANR